MFKFFPFLKLPIMSFGGLGDIFGDGGGDSQTTTQNDIKQLPEYPEAEGARKNWWDTLQQWQTQPGYGAIQPNWQDIWKNALGKVQRYFGGGPEGPGLNAQIKAGAARRGMSESPATDSLLQRSGFQEGNALQDFAVQQAMQEASLGEQGRQTWLGSIMDLAKMKPAFANFGSTTNKVSQPQQPGGFDYLSTLEDLFGQGAGGGSGGSKGFDMSSLMSMFGGASGEGGSTGGGDTGIGDLTDGGPSGSISGGDKGTEFYKDPNFYINVAKIAAMLFAG